MPLPNGTPTPYEHGYDCGKNGANETNCDFRIFSTQDRMKAWELGKKDAEMGREKRDAKPE